MEKCHKILLSGILSFAAFCAMDASEPLQKTDKDSLVQVREEKQTGDIPIPKGAPKGFSIVNNPEANNPEANNPEANNPEANNPVSKCPEPAIDKVLNVNVSLLKVLGVCEIEWDKGNAEALRFDPEPFLLAAKKNNLKAWIWFNWGGGSSKSGKFNMLSKNFRQQHYDYIDKVAEINARCGNPMEGFYYDYLSDIEIFDLHQDDIIAFRDFCREEYGEEYTATGMPPKPNPDDKWWRRFLVFKYCISESFCKDLTDYAHKKGFKVIIFRYENAALLSSANGHGDDPYRLSKIGDYQCSCSSNPILYENMILYIWKDLNTTALVKYMKGYPLTYYMYHNIQHSDKNKLICGEIMKTGKEWLNAERLAEIAVLEYPVALCGKFIKPAPIFEDNDLLITTRLSQYFATERIDVRDTRLYEKYKILIVPRWSGYSIPSFAYQGLLEWVKKGGTLIALDTEFSIGERDLTNPRPVISDLCGVEVSSEKIPAGDIKFSKEIIEGATLDGKNIRCNKIQITDNKAKTLAECNGNPVIVDRPLEKGHVISSFLDIPGRIKQAPKWLDVLVGLINYSHQPIIASSGEISIGSALKKDSAVMLSLYSGSGTNARTPSVKSENTVSGIIRMNARKIGLHENRYQLFKLSDHTLLPKSKQDPYWTENNLEEGIPLSIAADAGYENLLIEKAGTLHDGEGVLAKLKEIESGYAKDIKEGKEHPLGLRKDPFLTRIMLKESQEKSKAKWILPQPYRMELGIENEFAWERNGEPVIIRGEDLINAAGGRRINRNSMRIYELNEAGEEKEIISQTDRFNNDKSELLNKSDEFVFVVDLNAGSKKNYLLYYTDQENKGTEYRGLGVVKGNDKDGKAVETITTGFNKVELSSQGQLRIYDQKTGKPVLFLAGVGDRYAGYSHAGDGVYKWVLKGPVRCRMALDTKSRRDTFHNVYDFYYGSPYIRLSYSSNEKAIVQESFYWPSGNLLGDGKGLSILTDKGWWPSAYKGDSDNSLMPLKSNMFTMVKQGQDASFGWLLAYSNIFIPPYMLVTAGQIYFEFSKYHCIYTPADNPEVEWIYVHRVENEQVLDKHAESIKTPLRVSLGKEENKL